MKNFLTGFNEIAEMTARHIAGRMMEGWNDRQQGILLRAQQRKQCPPSLIVTVLFLFCTIFMPSTGSAWTIQNVDAPKSFFGMSSRSIAIDKTTGRPHIAYGENHLYHAYYNGVQWVSELVDDSPGVGTAASIAVDVNGKIHISYYDSTNKSLKYATNVMGAWQAITVDTDGVGINNSIALDSNNKVHIGYFDNTNFIVKYATNITGSWVLTTVDTGYVGLCAVIAIDSNNKVHISYADFLNRTLKYATNASGSWVPTTVDSTYGVGTDLSIALDGGNKVHLSYLDSTNYDMKYATNVSGIWVPTTIDSVGDVGMSTSIAIGTNNSPYITYYDTTNKRLKYATSASGSWVAAVIDNAGDVGLFSSIAIDSGNKAHVSYYDGTNHNLKYATNASGAWVLTAVDNAGEVGVWTSLATDSGNKVHISYCDWTNHNLKYATNASGIWVLTTIDSAGEVGWYTSIALDSSNKVHISYYDNTNHDLKYATNASGSWVLTTVDSSSADVGRFTSITTDSGNKVHISYYDATNRYLKYATNASGIWVTTILDGLVDNGFTSIALDTNKKVHISYYASTNGGLKYITNASGVWVATSVDNLGYNGAYTTSIALDSGNKVHISYQDYTNKDLKYATNASGSWVLTTVDSAGDVGGFTSIALDSSQKVHISYYDGTNREVKYATNATGSWVLATLDSAGDVGFYTSIALDSAKKAHISYQDSTNGALKYATDAPIDQTPPIGTIKINNNALYTVANTVTLALTCGDLQGVCSKMQFSNDGASWAAIEAYAASKASWDITAAAYGGTSVDGIKTVYTKYMDSAGNWSDPVSASITLDAIVPSGSVSISGAPLVNTAAVTLSLTCTDGSGSGCSQMQFSNNNANWSPLIAYVSSASWNLADAAYGGNSTNGTKTVYVQYRDVAGNPSLFSSVTGTITLDTVPPTGSITSFQGLTTYTTTPNVTLNLSCNDATTACSQMRFSNDGVTFSTPVSYAASTAWNLTNASYGGTSADGSKTVYAQFRDTAGNWSSAVIMRTIILDTIAPSGTVQVNANAANTTNPAVTLTVTCSDATSGCGQMRFSNDNAAWSSPATFATTTSWNLISGFGGTATDGTKTVYTQFRDTAVGAWSSSFSDSIFLDYNAPVTTASVPGGNQPNSLGVTLICGDNTAGTGSGCFKTYYVVTSNPAVTPTTASAIFTMGTITVDGSSSMMHLKFFSVDNLGNSESIKTETYTFVSATTHLSILLSTQTIVQTGSVDVSGSLSEYSTSDIDLSGLPISLTVTGPTGTTVYNTVTDSVNGHYIFTEIGKNSSVFSQKGTYGITAHFAGTGLLQSADSSAQMLLVGNSAGYAVIVEGKVPNDEGLASHNKTANRIYQHLLDRGFAAANIFYYNYAAQPGVDGTPSKSAVQNAIETLVKDKMNSVPAPLWIIMVDHGSPEKFYLDNEWISPAEFNTWLTTLENSLTASALLEKRVIVIGACYSGSFISALVSAPTSSDAGRIVITSAAAGEESYKGPLEPDNIRSGEFFLEEFFKELVKGTSIKDAFALATENTEAFTSQGGNSANSANAYGDSSVQHPLLNDSGSGSGSNTLSDGAGDGQYAEGLYLGVGLTNSIANPADLVLVTPTLYLDNATTAAVLTAVPDVYDYVDTAWVEVKAPSTVLVAQGGTGQLELNIPKKFMLPDGVNEQWNLTYGSSCTNNECFNTAGKYEIYYFTRNLYTEEISLLKKSVVYKDKAVNTSPTMVSLLTPSNGGQTKTSLILDWTDSIDQDGDSVTYTLILSSSPSFTSEAYRKEDLPVSITALGPEAGLQDLTTYYWKVLAVDPYGALSTSPTWSFTTNNTNDTNGIVLGLIKSSATGTGISNAGVTVSTAGTVYTASNGAYYIEAPSGAATLSVSSASGYTLPVGQGITIVSGSTLRRDVTLDPDTPTTYGLTVHTAGTGTGTITSLPAGISCGGDCAESYNAGQSVTLTATPDAGSVFSGWSGACSGTGICSLTMTQIKDATATFSPAGAAVPDGILTGGTSPSIADALRALRIAAGLIAPTATDFAHGDVAPLVNGVPQPDNKIDINDAIVILRKSVGLVSW